jgi:hypothetical protein
VLVDRERIGAGAKQRRDHARAAVHGREVKRRAAGAGR